MAYHVKYEKEEDYIVLKQLGIDAVQGYYIGEVTLNHVISH